MTLDCPQSCPVTVEREYWMAAADSFDCGDFETAAIGFRKLGNKSKPCYNVAICYQNLEDQESALAMFQKSASCDPFLAISFFQLGNVHLRKGLHSVAINEFKRSLECLRGNKNIDYSQLGLNYILNAAEILYNQAMAYFSIDEKGLSVRCLVEAHRFREQGRNDIITEALRSDLQSRWLPFEIPKNLIFRPGNRPRTLSMSSISFPPIEKIEPSLFISTDGGNTLEEIHERKHSRSSTLTSFTTSLFIDSTSQLVGKVYLVGTDDVIEQIRLIDLSNDNDTTSTTFQELYQRVSEKLKLAVKFKLKFKDEEGDLITMVDDSDLQAALHISSLNPKASRLSLWCYPIN